MSNIRFFVADAFITEKIGSGNPAAVCFVPDDFSDDKKLAIAHEFNFSETVFIAGDNPKLLTLSFFKPTHQVPICAHATLAASFILFEHYYSNMSDLTLNTKFGPISVSKDKKSIQLNLPQKHLDQIQTTPLALQNWLGFEPLECYSASDRYIVLVKDLEMIKNFTFDAQQTKQLDKPIVTICAITGKNSYGYRYFTPKEARLEDPATGTAQMFLAPLVSRKLETPHLHSIQWSKRQGLFQTQLFEDKVIVSGSVRQFCSGHLN